MNIEDGRRQVKSLAKSFGNAFKGIGYCLRNERNMRIHLVVAIYVIAFSFFYKFNTAEYALLFLSIGMVLFAEAVNTAIEAIVNLQTQHYDNLARIAKDVAAGAVLICALFALAVGLILFVRSETLIFILRFFTSNLLWLAALVASLLVAVFFIFCFPLKIKR